MTLETIAAIVAALVGWPAFAALVIDILKYVGAVNDGTAGKWNLALNLVAFVLVGVAVGFFPELDIPYIDSELLKYVEIAAYVLALVIQILGTRAAHLLYVKTEFGKKYFSYESTESTLVADY